MAWLTETEPEAISPLYDRYRRIARASGVRPDDVEDVVQQAVQAVLEIAARGGDGSSSDAYCTGIIYKKIQAYHREQAWRRRRLVALEDLDPAAQEFYEPRSPSPDETLTKAAIRQTVDAVMAELSDEDQELLHLLSQPDLTNEQIAAQQQISMSAFYKRVERLYKVHVVRAVERVRRSQGKNGGGQLW